MIHLVRTVLGKSDTENATANHRVKINQYQSISIKLLFKILMFYLDFLLIFTVTNLKIFITRTIFRHHILNIWVN